MTPRGALLAAGGVGALLALMLWGALRTPDNDRSSPVATTYSSGARGAKALYLLLQQSGLEVSRLRGLTATDLGPAGDGDRDDGLVLWILAPPPLPAADADLVVDFVAGGGTVVTAPELAAELLARLGSAGAKADKPTGAGAGGELLDTPWDLTLRAPPGSTRRLTGVEPSEVYASLAKQPIVAAYGAGAGAGAVVSLGLLDSLRNAEIGEDDAGPFLVRLAAALGQRHAFDELHTGYGNLNLVTLLWQTPYRWVSVEVGLLLLFAAWGLGSRERPAERDALVRRRETKDHVQAVADWWARSRDAGLPLTALLASLETRAARRVTGAAGARRFVAWAAAVRPELGERAARAWQRAEELLAHRRSPARELVTVAAELRTVEREVFPC